MQNIRSLARSGILDMAPYIPGKPAEQVQREFGLDRIIKLSLNENPLGPSPLAAAAMSAAIENANLYPEGTSLILRQKMAEKLGLSPAQIIIGTGGDHIINLITAAFLNPGDEMLCAYPTFDSYSIGAKLAGGIPVPVPLKERTHDLTAMAEAVTERTKLVIVCNPNNPTSTIVYEPELTRFLDSLPDSCIPVLDEAYFEFVTDPDFPDGLEYLRQGRQLIVVRTFSKVYGIAGCRIGYAVSTPEIMDILYRVLPAFPANRIAQAGALAALDDGDFVERTRKAISEGKRYLCGGFRRLGLDCADSQTNFLFVDVKKDAATVAEALSRRGVIIRPAHGWGYPTSLRVTIGTMEENRIFLSALEQVLKEME